MPEEPPKPKKKERAPPPPPPTAVSTACVLVRYAIGSMMANDNGDFLECAPFQATYMKDKPRLTGRVGLTATKAVADKTPLLDGKATALQQITANDFWNSLQEAIKRLTSTSSISIAYANVTKKKLFEKYGEEAASLALLDESQVGKKSKVKPDQPLTLALLKDNDVVVFACVVPGVPFASPSTALEAINLEMDQCDTKPGKKGFLFSSKWEAVPGSETSTEEAPLVESLPDSIPSILLSSEGQTLAQRVVSAEEEAAAKKQEKEAASAEKQQPEQKEMHVDPFSVEGTIDYTKLVDQFGSSLLDESLLKRLEALTVGKGRVPSLHRFLRRGIFFSHRDMHSVISAMEKNEAPLYLYTGRGPSSSAMHLGHLVPFLFTQWLQKAFDCPLVIQMTDDEKFIFKGEYDEHEGDNLEYFAGLTMENARDIIACGFDYEKTFLFSDLDYVGSMYPNIVRIWKAVTTNTINGIFGFDGSSNMGKIAFPAIQAAPSFASSFPTVLDVPNEKRRSTKQICLIPCAIDQDPYFRMTRDIAHKLVDKTTHPLGGKPALIHSKFFPPLQGAEGKMSSSNNNSAIFLTDSQEEIAHKIRAYCFSGGRETKAEQEKYGADTEIDVAYQWLRFFLEDDEELEKIGKDYSSGSGEYWSTGKVKDRLIAVLQKLVAEHQARRAKITDEEVRKWMTERRIVPPSS
mmetsp:Transcript_24278/g.50462  ORF Transcript_24278/g.50462 Transcript_24278/m.50462 type:complete len:689 (-) Transcript_24278:151-2217(-)